MAQTKKIHQAPWVFIVIMAVLAAVVFGVIMDKSKETQQTQSKAAEPCPKNCVCKINKDTGAPSIKCGQWEAKGGYP